MTRKELSSYYYLSLEIKDIENQIRELKENQIWSPILTGMPHGSGVSNPVEKSVERIMKLEKKLEDRRCRAAEQMVKIENYISSIKDPEARLIFSKRYIEFKTWVKISMEMYMGESTVFRIHKKVLEENND